jgi:CBS domain-containing protein
MKVKEAMTANPVVAGLTTTAAEAAQLMWEADCGVLPVVDAGRVVGIVTDRDLFIALATRNVSAAELKVGDVARFDVVSCEPEDDLSVALDKMRQRAVRRLPVVGFGGTLLGILSLNDVVLSAGSKSGARSADLIDTFQAICGRHRGLPQLASR